MPDLQPIPLTSKSSEWEDVRPDLMRSLNYLIKDIYEWIGSLQGVGTYTVNMSAHDHKSDGQGGDYPWADITAADVTWIQSRVIPTGTKMLFYASAAPTNWTIFQDLNDALVFITDAKVGSQTGGGAHSTGHWGVDDLTNANENSHTHTGPSHTHTTGDHTLTEAEMPVHHHHLTDYGPFARDLNSGAAYPLVSGYGPTATDSAGSGSAHNHGNTGAGGTGASGAGSAHTHTVSSAGTWRPAAYCFIICSKS